MEIMGGTGVDKIHDFARTPDGFLIVGSTTSFGIDEEDVYLVRVDEAGKMIWNRTWGDWESDRGYAVTRTSDNNYVVTGASSVKYGIGDDVLFLKINGEGKTLFNRSFGGNAWDWGSDVIELEDGDFLITGVTERFWVNTYDCYLVKTNSRGDLIWKRSIKTEGNFQMQTLIETTDGDFLILGSITDVLGHNSDIVLIKANSEGKEVWTRVFGGDEKDHGLDIIDTSDGYMVLCKTESEGENEYDTSLMKLDYDGCYIWSKSIGGFRDDECNSIIKTGSDEYVLVGKTYDAEGSGADILLMKVNSNGEILFNEKYGTTNGDSGVKVHEQDGVLTVFGETGGSRSKIIVLRIATAVNQLQIYSEYGEETGGGEYLNGSMVQLSVEDMIYQDSKTRQVFIGWRDENTGLIIAEEGTTEIPVYGNISLSAVWETQYYVEMSTLPDIHVEPESGWFKANSNITINCVSQNNTLIQGWSGVGPGSYTGDRIRAMICVKGPIVQTPLSERIQFFELNLESEYGKTTGSGSFQGNIERSFNLTPTVIEVNPGTRYLFTGWLKDNQHYSDQAVDSISLVEDTVLTAKWERQFYINSSVEGGEAQITGSGWWKEGSEVTVSCNPGSGYSFDRWEIWYSETIENNEISFMVTEPLKITAYLKRSEKCRLDVVSEYGETYGSTEGCVGDLVTFSVYPEVIDLTENTRVVFHSWSTSDSHGYNGTESLVTMTIQGDTVQEAVWVRQFFVFAGNEEIDGWYEENSSIIYDDQEEGSILPKHLRYSVNGEKITDEFKVTGPITLSPMWSYSMTTLMIAGITSTSIGYTAWRGLKRISGLNQKSDEEKEEPEERLESTKIQIASSLDHLGKYIKDIDSSELKTKIMARLKRSKPESDVQQTTSQDIK